MANTNDVKVLCPGCARQLNSMEYRSRHSESRQRGKTVYTCRYCESRFTVRYDIEAKLFKGERIEDMDTEIQADGIKELLPILNKLQYPIIDAELALAIIRASNTGAKEAVSGLRSLLVGICEPDSDANKIMKSANIRTRNPDGTFPPFWSIVETLRRVYLFGGFEKDFIRVAFGSKNEKAIIALITASGEKVTKAVENLKEQS